MRGANEGAHISAGTSRQTHATAKNQMAVWKRVFADSLSGGTSDIPYLHSSRFIPLPNLIRLTVFGFTEMNGASSHTNAAKPTTHSSNQLRESVLGRSTFVTGVDCIRHSDLLSLGTLLLYTQIRTMQVLFWVYVSPRLISISLRRPRSAPDYLPFTQVPIKT